MEAIRRTEQWWSQQRRRGLSSAVSWTTYYASPLKPLLSIEKVYLKVLTSLVESKEVGSRSRRRASMMKAQLQVNGLVPIGGGKTGARQGLPLPKVWIEGWSLECKRLPEINHDRDHRTVGAQLDVALRLFHLSFAEQCKPCKFPELRGLHGSGSSIETKQGLK